MKVVIWLVLLFAVAVVGAMTLGANDGLASFYWRGWRLDLSLNLFILLMVAGVVAAVGGLRLTRWLLSMPGRARAWREGRRALALQNAQREALIEFIAARYSRTVKAAHRAQDLLQDLGPQEGHREARAVNHLMAALALHRLQDRVGRDEQARAVETCLGPDRLGLPAQAGDLGAGRAQSLREGLALLRAEWALDDRDAAASLQHLEQLAPGASRRIQAQRLRLQAHRLVSQPLEALRAARLLAKHQAFKPEAATSLLRTLAMAVLDTARDAEGLHKRWQELEREDRQDTSVLCHAVEVAVRLGASEWARRALRPAFEAAGTLAADQREDLARALWSVVQGVEPEWLPLIEPLEWRHAREPMVMALVGTVYAERQLWGKAQPLLEQAARSSVDVAVRRDAWCRLAHLALQRDDEPLAQRCFRTAAELR